MRCIKPTSKKSSSDGSRRNRQRGGVGGEKKHRWRRVPQEVVDTFLAHRHLPPGVLSLRVLSRYVRDVSRMPISRLTGCSSLHARDLHSLFRISFAIRDGHKEIGPRDCPDEISMKSVCVPCCSAL